MILLYGTGRAAGGGMEPQHPKGQGPEGHHRRSETKHETQNIQQQTKTTNEETKPEGHHRCSETNIWKKSQKGIIGARRRPDSVLLRGWPNTVGNLIDICWVKQTYHLPQCVGRARARRASSALRDKLLEIRHKHKTNTYIHAINLTHIHLTNESINKTLTHTQLTYN